MNTSEIYVQPFSALPAMTYLQSLSSNSSKRTMTSALRTLAAIEPRVLDGTLTYESALALRAELLQRYAPRTANRLLSAARGVLRAALNLGLRSEYERVFSALRAIKSFQLPTGRLLENAEVAALARACQDGTLSGIRDAALLGVLLCGLRRSEVVALRTSDYDAEQGRLIVHGKGRKERDVYLPQAVQRALNAWLQWRVGDGALFTPIKYNVIVNARLSAQSVYNVLLKRATQAGVWKVSPHDLRRTFVSRLLESGADVIIVARLAGHSDPKTTAIYDKRADDAARQAVARLDFPL